MRSDMMTMVEFDCCNKEMDTKGLTENKVKID